MPVVTITSEWNLTDFYLAAVKGALLTETGVQAIEISSDIQKFNIAQAAFALKNSYKFYPEGSIHLVAVKSERTENHPFIVFYNDGHYFIGADNGIFGLVFEEKPDKIVEINLENSPVEGICDSTFPELTVLVKVAGYLAKGGQMRLLGADKYKVFRTITLLQTIDDATIEGAVLYIDSYQNAITNITNDLFYQVGKNRPFEIFVQSNYYKITKINKTYNETSDGELLALFNSLNYLEIAINNGNAAELLNLHTKSNIRIKFYDNPNR